MTNAIIIMTTTTTHDEAKRISHQLIGQKLAACVNIIPQIESTFHWKGEIINEKEHLLLIKTHKTLEKQVFEQIKTMHSYDVPEIISIPIIGADDDYLNWITEETGN